MANLYPPNKRLKDMRLKLHVCGTLLARKVGVCPQMIYMYECGFRKPSLDTAKKIADALQCDVSEIF